MELRVWQQSKLDMCWNMLAIMSRNCHNTHVINMLDTPVVVQDISDAVVIVSNDGILVTSKEGSAHLKDLVDQVS